jgi:ABC-type nitrate/sulfonate/bicarbonate transport system ATPase subunit
MTYVHPDQQDSIDRHAILPLRLERVGYALGGKPLLADIDLAVTAGRRCVVMGANGAGKTLLLRLCHGLIEPTSGTRNWRNGEAGPRPRPWCCSARSCCAAPWRPISTTRSRCAACPDPSGAGRWP